MRPSLTRHRLNLPALPPRRRRALPEPVTWTPDAAGAPSATRARGTRGGTAARTAPALAAPVWPGRKPAVPARLARTTVGDAA